MCSFSTIILFTRGKDLTWIVILQELTLNLLLQWIIRTRNLESISEPQKCGLSPEKYRTYFNKTIIISIWCYLRCKPTIKAQQT